MNQPDINETTDAKLERLIQKEKENTARVQKAAAKLDAFFEELFKKKAERLNSESDREANLKNNYLINKAPNWFLLRS